MAIVVEPSRASEVIPYQGDQALEGYPVLRESYPVLILDDQGFVSQSRVTILHLYIFQKNNKLVSLKIIYFF